MVAQVNTESYSVKSFWMITMTLLFTQLIFLSLGIVISIVFLKIKSVLTVSLGTVFAFFIIGLLVSTTDDGVKRYLTPFKYFDTAYIIENSSYEISFMLTAMGIIAISLVASYIIYTKKDI